MPDGPLFPDGGDDYAYDDDSEYAEEGDSSGPDANSGPSSAAASKSEFEDSDTSSRIICRPGKKAKKKAKKKICSVATITGNLSTCDGGSHAWENAQKAAGKAPTVEVKKTASGFDAETSGSTITIKPTSNCCDATESLLFELHNVESQTTFKKIDDDAAKGLYSREDYTRANEQVEYQGLKRSWETFAKCKKAWGCGAGAKSFADGFKKSKSFDDYYKHYLVNSHKNHYRKYWDSTYKGAYKPPAKKKGP